MRCLRSVSFDINLPQVQVQNCSARKMNIQRVYYVALHEALGSVGSDADAGWTMESCETDFRFVWREQRSQLMAVCWLGSQAHIQPAQAPWYWDFVNAATAGQKKMKLDFKSVKHLNFTFGCGWLLLNEWMFCVGHNPFKSSSAGQVYPRWCGDCSGGSLLLGVILMSLWFIWHVTPPGSPAQTRTALLLPQLIKCRKCKNKWEANNLKVSLSKSSYELLQTRVVTTPHRGLSINNVIKR